MVTSKRTVSDAGILHYGEHVAKRNNSLGFDARTPWLQDCKPSRTWRTLGDRAVQPSLPLENMVAAVQDLIDPDFDPLVAILDEEPRFLKPLPARIAPEDLEFLRFRGALSIPEDGLRNELLRCYIKWVHSFMPVINLQDFLRCIAENDPNGNISLLLFQAVMFVATAFVDLDHLQDAGYATRKIARSAFYTRLRLLYSLDCEEDRIVILQTLLLMTYWTDHVNHPQRDIWDWVGICNTQAHSIGLNQDPTTSLTMDPKTKRLRIRLWWSLYSRDRLISLGMRRPTQVNEGTSNVPMLRLEDFDYESFHPSVIQMFHCRQLEDPSHQKRLATMFIEQTKLCQCIGRVLFAQYSPSQRLFGITNRTTITLAPRQASEPELARCSQRLDSWVNSLPKDAQFIPASKTNFNDGEDVLLLHGAMIRMLYHATISALYRPWAYGSNKRQSKSRMELINTARSKMHDAAIGITHIIQGLSQLDLTRFLPQSGVTVIIPATVLHLANSMSDNPMVREASIRSFHRCVQVLQGLKELYPAADMEVANIEAAVRVHSESANTLLKVMQSSSININQSQPVEQCRSESDDVPTIQTLSPLQDQTPDQWISPIEADTANMPQNSGPGPPQTSPIDQWSNRNSTVTPVANNASHLAAEQDYLTPSNDFDDHFNSALNTNSPLLDATLNPSSLHDLDSYNIDFPLPNSISHPDIDIDWAEDFLRGVDFNVDFSSSPREEHSRDFFSFAEKREHIPNIPRKEEITGDLDKDLGLNSGDEMF
ncbi:fungal-specific transcription factor domain-containing protein [Aspergillus coremiiformis]|uniref:Fungal-specific transcription factor domain-containing protein n=1 Tax=Aspergillus coremiiformis TaxID=138285 RepID=A0A5N6YVS2_9EURO|nr:fungal-specific transcription factor domain-containing protein [Aspergillus coremiiformis]